MFGYTTLIDKEEIEEALHQLVEHELGKATQSFSDLYLVSWSKQIFLKWSLKNDKQQF